MKDRLKPYEREIEYCAYCPKLCRFACPVGKVTCSEASTPTGKMTILKLVKDSALSLSPEVAELMYQCSGCILSRTYCEHRIEVISALEAIRAIAVEKGIAPKRVQEFGPAFQKLGNPYAENFSRKLKEIIGEKHLADKSVRAPKKADTLIFTGCTMTHYFPETIKDLIKVLESLNFEFAILDDADSCCGYPLFALGHWQILEEHQKKLAQKITGYDQIISLCPTCVWYLRTRYQKPGLIQVGSIEHSTEFLSTRLGQLRLKAKMDAKIVYHDPCHLGRYLGIYDAPREILNWISKNGFAEFYENREQSECCGGGGGLPLSHPQIARGISKHKIKQFQSRAGQILATACPMCERMFARTGKEEGILVRDLVSLIAERLA